MGIVNVFQFSSDSETVTRTKLNGLSANVVTEFNGNITNENIAASAGISATKLNLATIAQNISFGGAITFGSTVSFEGATTFDEAIEVGVNTVLTTGDLASKAEAEAGTNNTKLMTPLRTKEAITENVVPIADQAEAEAGTDNTKVMTSLRVKQSLDANTPIPFQSIQFFTANGTWTKPAGVSSVFVRVVGGGGGGGYGPSNYGGTGGTSSFAGVTTIQGTGGTNSATPVGGSGSGGYLNRTGQTGASGELAAGGVAYIGLGSGVSWWDDSGNGGGAPNFVTGRGGGGGGDAEGFIEVTGNVTVTVGSGGTGTVGVYNGTRGQVIVSWINNS